MYSKRKRLFSLFLTVILCLSACPVTSFAADISDGEVQNVAEGDALDGASLITSEDQESDDPVVDDGETEAGGVKQDSEGSENEEDESVDPQGKNEVGDSDNKGQDASGEEGKGELSGSGTGEEGDGELSGIGIGDGSEGSAGSELPEDDTSDDKSGDKAPASSVAKDPYHVHQYVPVVTEPTCTEKGYTTYACSCGDSYVDDYTDPLGHSKIVDIPEIPATAESSGTTAGKKCGVCGEILEGCEEIPALSEETRKFDSSVITGFDVTGLEEIREEDKPILDELMEELPSEITIFVGGTLSYKIDKADKSGDAGRSDETEKSEDGDKSDDNDKSDNFDQPDNLDKQNDDMPGDNGNADDNVRTDDTDEDAKADGEGSASPGRPEGAEKKTVSVTWICLQDYDEDLTVFEFMPELEGYELAPGISLPVQKVYIESEVDGPVGGHIPTETGGDVPFAVSTKKRGASSAAFNAYESGLLPPVRNQGSEGACWSFAAIGAMETDLILGGSEWDRNSIDLSELYLAYYTTHKYPDSKGCNTGDSVEYIGDEGYLSNGGNNELSYRTMANMVGPVAESTAPYPNGSPNGPNVAQMTGAYLYNPEDRAGIKAAILAHGSVDAAMYWTSACYSSTYNSYYYPNYRANHEVMLVGWDDSFPASHFRSSYQPNEGQDGAWLVRNSWGKQGYGYDGYFWMSYYDRGLLSDVVTAYDAERPRYDSCYAYDSVPYPDAQRYLSRGETVSQSYTLKGAEIVRAVGFETGGSNVTATVTVSNGQAVSTGQINVGNKGFYIAELNTPLSGTAGQRITVTLGFSSESSIMYEDGGYTVRCGDTVYGSCCGGGGHTVDGYTYPYDARIKLYTDNDSSGGMTPISGITLSESDLDLLVGDHQQLYVTLQPENAFGRLSWVSSNPNVARVDQGLVMAVSPGTADVTVTSNNGISAVCRVTVNAVSVKGIIIQGFSSNPKVSEITDTNENSGFAVPNPYPIELQYRMNPQNATNQRATWTSSNPSVASVTTVVDGSTGRTKANVYIKDNGTAVITVKSVEGNYSDTLTFKVNKTMCTLSYNANGGTGAPASQRISKGATISLQSGRPTRSGFTFTGWALSKSATTAQYQPGASFKVTGNSTFYAVWQDNRRKCTLSFNANGGTGAPVAQSVYVGSAVTLPTVRPSRSGYTFKGWATESNATLAQYQPGGSFTPAGNTTFYALWANNQKVVEYVKRCYRTILGREGEKTGVDYWSNLICTGAKDGASIVSGFIDSKEFKNKRYNNDQVVTILYRSMLGREPESSGRAYWRKFLDAGMSYDYVINGFAVSQEFGRICASYGITPGSVAITQNRDRNYQITDYVSRCYRQLLGRDGDVAGLNYWTGELISGSKQGASIVEGFVKSDEYYNRHLSNSASVELLYQSMLGRASDKSGKEYWLSFLDSGASLSYVVAGFARSVEFGRICSSYGIQPGTVKLTESRDQNIRVTQFVQRNYVYALNRRGEPSGLNYWTDILLSKSQTPRQVCYGFVFSKECINKNLSNRDFVYMLYRLYLGREPEKAGLDYWLNILNRGGTRQSVANGFADSVEFQGIVRSFGL